MQLSHHDKLAEQLERHGANHLRQTNWRYLLLLAVHIPVFVGIGSWMETGPMLALSLSCIILSGPVLMMVAAPDRLVTSLALGAAGMCMSGLLIHLGRGLVELHFHIFVLLAVSTAFGKALVLWVETLTVVIHHVAFWLWIPDSLLNYDAPFSVVLLHAAFVIAQVTPTSFVAERYHRFIVAAGVTTESLTELTASVHRSAQDLLDSNAEVIAGVRIQEQEALAARASLDQLQQVTDRNLACVDTIKRQTAAAHNSALSSSSGLQQMMEAIDAVAKSNKSVSSVVRSIEDIAAETDILSLNAAVEAARAGEAGRGFGVVADQVGRLARQSAEAARRTADQIGGANKRTERGVSVTHDVVQSVEAILQQVIDIDLGSEELSLSASSQSQMISELGRSIAGMNEVAARASGKAELGLGIASSLEDQVKQLDAVSAALAGLVRSR